MRRLAIALATLAAAAGGVTAASLLTSAPAVSRIPVARDELPAQTDELGARADDPRGGPQWAVRILDRDAGSRCIAAARTLNGLVGRADTHGGVVPLPGLRVGSCAEPASDPLQVALARFGAASTAGERSVLMGIAGAGVESVRAEGPDEMPGAVALDVSRSFIVVREGLSEPGSWTVTATLEGGGSRTYRL